MVKEKTEKDNWQFVFLSADLDAFREAGAIGIMDHKRRIFAKDKMGSQQAWSGLSVSMSKYRSSAPKEDFKFETDDKQGDDRPS